MIHESQCRFYTTLESFNDEDVFWSILLLYSQIVIPESGKIRDDPLSVFDLQFDPQFGH